MRAVEFDEDSRRDLREICAWYETQDPGLSREFLGEFEGLLTLISQTPAAFRVIHRGARRVLVHRFPYHVYYSETEASVKIIGVFHTSRHPDVWMRRISGRHQSDD